MYDIIHEHSDFLVLNKYAGVNIHTDNQQLGLIETLAVDFPGQRFFPVHRLDKVTTGLLLVAKSHTAASVLSQLFQYREIEKYYLALSDQKPKKKQGLIKGDMVRSRRSAWKLCHTHNNPAITQFFSHSVANGQRLYIIKPATGKTHQIRVALKSIGAPIVGDRLYGHPVTLNDQIYLHAYSLCFEYLGQQYAFMEAPKHWLADNAVIDTFGLAKQLEDMEEPWHLPWPSL